MKQAPEFEVGAVEDVTLDRTNRLTDMYVLSPFVWKDGASFHMLLRAVPRRDDEPRLKMAEIWHGASDNGLHFKMESAPTIFPGPDIADLDGCEDPTVHVTKDRIRVWYTGYNHREKSGRLLCARGPAIDKLAKTGVALSSAPPRYGSPKEAAIADRGADGWRLFFEFAREGASLIGMVDGDDLDGPWSDPADAPLKPRQNKWDNWHLSPGPIVRARTNAPVMFYNGATHDAHWRIGWAVFDRSFERVIARCDEPLLTPLESLDGTETNIAFAASAVETAQGIYLYYSVADQHLRRTLIQSM